MPPTPPPAAPPPPPPPYAYPAYPPAPYGQPQRQARPLVIVGLVTAVVVVLVIVGIVLRTTLKHRHHPKLTPEQGAFISTDVRDVAEVEERYVAHFGTYTNSRVELGRAGFTMYPGNPDYDALVVGFNGATGYCIVGAVNDNSPWLLYDSEHGLLQHLAYETAAEAESYCSDKSITNFLTVN